jgi:SsrA-binding protein
MTNNNSIENRRDIAVNRRAKFDYSIEDTIEAGIVLTGTEIKSLREGQASIVESYADHKNGEIFLVNANIPEYKQANRFNHYPKRVRKLLLRKKEINKLAGLLEKKGYTLVPLSIYINKRNLAKIALGLAKGKKQHEKRDAIKEREWQRRKAQVIRES